MTSLRDTAEIVSRWTGLGIKLPKDLGAAIEVYDALKFTEVDYPIVFDADSVTPANAGAKLREYADELALAEALPNAKRKALEDVSRRVLRHARTSVAEIIETLTPEFDRHAEAYVTAVSKLPDELTAESLVAVGPDALVAYREGQTEAGHLNSISGWVASTRDVTGGDIDVVLRILRPSSLLELDALDSAAARRVEPTLQAIDPVLFTAAKQGVEFGINTLPEAAALRRELSAVSASSVKTWR